SSDLTIGPPDAMIRTILPPPSKSMSVTELYTHSTDSRRHPQRHSFRRCRHPHVRDVTDKPGQPTRADMRTTLSCVLPVTKPSTWSAQRCKASRFSVAYWCR